MTAQTEEYMPTGDFSVHRCHDLKPQHRYMLAYLIDNAAEWADADGWVKFGRRSLGERLGLDHAMIRRLIAALEQAGYLQVETGGGAQKYSRYKLVLNDKGQGVISAPVTKSDPVQKQTATDLDRSNIVPLNSAKTRRKPDKKPSFEQKQHRVSVDSHGFESEFSKKDSIRIEDDIVEKLTRLFLEERAKAHPSAMPVSEQKTRHAIQQCLEEGIKPENLAANIAGGMKRGRFRDDPPSSPAAFKRSAAENWGGKNFQNPAITLTDPVVLPGIDDIASFDEETREALFGKVVQSLRLRSPQKAAALDPSDIAGWAGYVRADFL